MPHPDPIRAEDSQDFLSVAGEALQAAEGLLADSAITVRARVAPDRHILESNLMREQRAAHGLAWLATYVEAVRQLIAYAERMRERDRFGDVEELTVRIALGEYVAQIFTGIPISQSEIVRPCDLGLSLAAVAARCPPAVDAVIESGNTAEHRARLIELICAKPDTAIGTGHDQALDVIRDELRRFATGEIVPHAQTWHLANDYVPLATIAQMADIGVFGLTIPESHGGMGLGKESMCVVAEELSRASLAVGSLCTRSEIAAELILGGGTPEQQRRWLPRIAGGAVLPTAVFTEPNAGSDLAAIRTRAVRHGNVYKIYGNKTWITHAARADLMLILARTNPKEKGYRGLSILLAEKPRGSDADLFPVAGLTGTEIEVIGYRGMKEFELAFDGFEVTAENLLGGIEGLGFKQLMQTFETARIQTSARAIGVTLSAIDQALAQAQLRVQFDTPIVRFPRVGDKIAMMLADMLAARELTYFAARRKDSGRRCDVEAGMAKLLAARNAWAAADGAVQIHGGTGFSIEHPVSRLLCDARVLSIFEGSAEIQAQIIAKRLIEGGN